MNLENGYSVCYNKWALDTSIKNELNLLLIISSLTAKTGYCIASNQYFASLFDIHEKVVSKKIQKLEKKNYIQIDYERRGCEVIRRYIRVIKLLPDELQKDYSTSNEKITYNNISINNKEIYKENEAMFQPSNSTFDRRAISENVNKKKCYNTSFAKQNTEVETNEILNCLADEELKRKTMNNWNCLAEQYNFPKIQDITKTRLQKLKARLKTCDSFKQFWDILQDSIDSSKFLRYGNDNWRCNFDFVIQESSFQKIREKQYK